MKKVIVIPTYNERENIEALTRSVFDLGIEDLSIVVVDDASPDGTGKIIRDLMKKYSVDLIERDGKLGLGSAYIAGFKRALGRGAELIFEMDADFSHDPKYLPDLIKAVEIDGFDVAIGSRRVEQGTIVGWNWWRHFCSAGAMFFSKLALGIQVKDITAGFRCYKREVLEKLNLDRIKSNGYAFQEEMIYRCERNGFSIKEVPINFVDRKKGKSKLGFKDIMEFFITVLRLRFKK